MKRIEVYLYKSQKPWQRLADRVISSYTGIFPCNCGTEPYSHAAMGLEDSIFNIITIESTSRKTADGSDGVRGSTKDVLLRNPERWDMLWTYVTPNQLRGMRARADMQNGKPYDWLGIAGFAMPVNIQKKDKWYCSELVWYILTGKISRVSPRHLSKWIKKLGFQKGAL